MQLRSTLTCAQRIVNNNGPWARQTRQDKLHEHRVQRFQLIHPQQQSLVELATVRRSCGGARARRSITVRSAGLLLKKLVSLGPLLRKFAGRPSRADLHIAAAKSVYQRARGLPDDLVDTKLPTSWRVVLPLSKKQCSAALADHSKQQQQHQRPCRGGHPSAG